MPTTPKKSARKRVTTRTTRTAKKATAGRAPKKTAAGKSKTGKSTKKATDALSVLRGDHERVTSLFDKFESLGPRAHKTRRSTIDVLIEELAVHAGIEESVFYPALRERFVAKDDSLVLEGLEEHHVVKLLLAELQAMSSDDERFTPKVTVLRELVDHHVEEEESDMFTKARRVFSSAELVALGDELVAARSSAPKRPHPESPDTPPANLLSNVVTAPLDAASNLASRASDAVHQVID